MKNRISKIREKINQIRATVDMAPQLIRHRICGNLLICAVLIALSVLALLISLIPALSNVQGVAIIGMIIAAYLILSLPGYLQCCKNYIEVSGTVKDVKKSALKSLKSARSCRVIKLTDYDCREYSNDTVALDHGEEIDILIPDTYFIRVIEGRKYRFYYTTDYKKDDDRFAVSGFVACNTE